MPKKQEKLLIDIPVSVIIKIILVGLLFVFLYLLVDVLIILLFAFIIASAITPFADWLERRKLPRLLGITLLYLSVFALFVFFLSLVIPTIAIEINQLVKDLPTFIQSVSTSIEQAQESTSSKYFDFSNEILNILDSFSQYLATSSSSIINFIIGIFGGLISFAAIIVISFYLAYMRKGVENFIRAIIPSKYESVILGIWNRSEKKVGRWVQGQLLLALIVGLTVYVGLSLLGVKFALLLGILAMILELVPNVGPILAAIPALLLGFSQSMTLGISVVVLYIVIQQIENHVLVPLILGKALGLNPIVVIISLLVGAKLAGLLGVILGVPVAAILMEAIEEIAKHTGYKKVAS